MSLISKVFGTYSERQLKKIEPIVDKIEALADKYKAMTDSELQGQTALLKERLKNGETKDDILPDAFAVVREAADRVLGPRHYRVQLIGGIVIHQGRIAEMKTGEGKTQVATLPAYLNALDGNGVHVVTVNDYLAKRDSEWMGKLYNFLGLSVGLIINGMKNEERKAAYAADITYGTNNEMGFDYLRDNMVIYKEQLVLRELHYCIIDEVDSVLIDEARTPLIISGQSGKSTKLYETCDYLAQRLHRGQAKELSKMDILMQEEEIREDLYIMREALQEALPSVEERIAWSMPTYWKEHNILHFAANKKHIGYYVGIAAVEAFSSELTGYKTNKGTVQIPYGKVNKELVGKIAAWCLATGNHA